MPITTLRIYNSSGDLASCLISNEASAIQCQQVPCEYMDVDVQSNSTIDNRSEMHSPTRDPIEANNRMDTDEQESTLLDVRETTENFTTGTTDQTTVSSTPPSRNTQQYEPQTMLGKQIVQLLEDKRLTHKFDKLRVAAKECEKGDRTHKCYE